MFESLILGVSAAGVSAAIYLARRNVNFKLLGLDFGGEMALSGEVGNYPGLGATNGIALTQKFAEHLKIYEIKPELGSKITWLEKKDGLFIVKANGSEYRAKSVILATGSHPRELGVSGEKELRGKGVSYCTVCDGPIFKDKVVVTVGGGDSASESGIMMNEIASKVYVLTINQDMKGDTSLIKKLGSLPRVEVVKQAETTRILGNDFVSGVEYRDLKTGAIKTIKSEAVFIHVGMVPNVEFVKIPELERNKAGEIVVDKFCRTNVPGLFAAGDLTDLSYKQIGIAVGQGISAALSCVDYLNRN